MSLLKYISISLLIALMLLSCGSGSSSSDKTINNGLEKELTPPSLSSTQEELPSELTPPSINKD